MQSVKRKVIEFVPDDQYMGRPVDVDAAAVAYYQSVDEPTALAVACLSLSVSSVVIWFCITHHCQQQQQQQNTAGFCGPSDRPRAIFFNSCAPFAPHLTTNDINFAGDDTVTARASVHPAAPAGAGGSRGGRRAGGLSLTA